MANKLGNKHLCEECGTKFYDFGKSHIICPKCGAEVLGETKKDSRKAPAEELDTVDEETKDLQDEDATDEDEGEDEEDEGDEEDEDGLVGDEFGDEDEDEDDFDD